MKESNIKTIWRVPKYLPYVQPDLTNEILVNAEKLIGYKLPKDYVEILKIQNGGYIRFTLQDTVHSQIYGIGPYFPSLTQFDWTEDQEYVSFNLDGLFPFDGDGHWHLCLDYRKNKSEPEITLIDTELDSEKFIAKNFQEYLSCLALDIKDEYTIESNLKLEALIEKISLELKIEFEEPDSFSHGYPVYRSKFKNAWVWISSNKVPTGFIRKDDYRYDELKSLMEKTSLRYPEISENFYFLSVSEDEAGKELFSQLRGKSFVIRRLKELIYKKST